METLFYIHNYIVDGYYNRKVFVKMKSDFLSDFLKGFLIALGVVGVIFLYIELTR